MNKIEALEKTIYSLENNLVEYSWTDSRNCNCGVLARTLIDGKSPYEYGYGQSPALSDKFGPFANSAYCMTTNLPIPKVFQALKDAGFTHKELVELEYLGSPIIGKMAGLEVSAFTEHTMAAHHQFNKKECLIKYLKAWIELLKSQPPVIKERIKYISVPETLSHQAKLSIATSENFS